MPLENCCNCCKMRHFGDYSGKMPGELLDIVSIGLGKEEMSFGFLVRDFVSDSHKCCMSVRRGNEMRKKKEDSVGEGEKRKRWGSWPRHNRMHSFHICNESHYVQMQVPCILGLKDDPRFKK